MTDEPWTRIPLEKPEVRGAEYLILYRTDRVDPVIVDFQIQEWEMDKCTDHDDPYSGYTPFIEGHIKWDGCSNWMQAEKDCMLHFCGGIDGLAPLQDAFKRCFAKAAELIRDYDT